MGKDQNKDKIKESGRQRSLANLELGKFKKGESGNPDGRPKGQRNYLTIYREALEELAKANKITPEQLENKLVLKQISESMTGNFKHLKDLLDRVHGMPVQKQEVETNVQGNVIISFDPIFNE